MDKKTYRVIYEYESDYNNYEHAQEYLDVTLWELVECISKHLAYHAGSILISVIEYSELDLDKFQSEIDDRISHYTQVREAEIEELTKKKRLEAKHKKDEREKAQYLKLKAKFEKSGST